MIGLIIVGFVARQILKAKVTAAVHATNAVMNLPETLDKAHKAAEAKRETAAEAAKEASDPQYRALKTAERAKSHAQMLEELEQIQRQVLERDRERERQKAEEERIKIEGNRKGKALVRAEFVLLFSSICLLCYYNIKTPPQNVQAPPTVGNQNSEKSSPDTANHEYIYSNPTHTEQSHSPVDADQNTEQYVDKQNQTDSTNNDGSKNLKAQIVERAVKSSTDADPATGAANSSDAPDNPDGTPQISKSQQKPSLDNGDGTVTVYVDDSSGQVVPEGTPDSHSETFTAGTEPAKLSPNF